MTTSRELSIKCWNTLTVSFILNKSPSDVFNSTKSVFCAFYDLFWSEDIVLRRFLNLVIVRGLSAFHSSRIIIANLGETVISLQSFS